MKNFKHVAAMLSALMLILAFAPSVSADTKQGDSITIVVDRRVMPQSIFHVGRFFVPDDRKEVTVEVYDPVIRNYQGDPINGFTIQTVSGRTFVPIETVETIKLNNWIDRRTDDIPRVEHTVKADILFTSGRQKQVVMNADFGTIEGKTDRGDFFLSDAQTVRCISFHRCAAEE